MKKASPPFRYDSADRQISRAHVPSRPGCAAATAEVASLGASPGVGRAPPASSQPSLAWRPGEAASPARPLEGRRSARWPWRATRQPSRAAPGTGREVGRYAPSARMCRLQVVMHTVSARGTGDDAAVDRQVDVDGLSDCGRPRDPQLARKLVNGVELIFCDRDRDAHHLVHDAVSLPISPPPISHSISHA